MKKMNPQKITYSQLWDRVCEDYPLEDIFPNKYNQRLVKFNELCDELKPDLDEELQKLGFSIKQARQNYYNDNGDIVTISRNIDMVISFNDKKLKIGYDGIVGKQERIAIDWIKKMLSDEKRT